MVPDLDIKRKEGQVGGGNQGTIGLWGERGSGLKRYQGLWRRGELGGGQHWASLTAWAWCSDRNDGPLGDGIAWAIVGRTRKQGNGPGA